MYDIFVGFGIFLKRFAGSACNGLIRWVDVDDLQVLSVQHPENLLDVGGHLLESLFALAQRRFRLLPAGDVSQDGNMLSGQVIRLRCVFDEDGLAVSPDNLYFAMLVLAIEKPFPGVLEVVTAPIELTYWLADQFVAPGSKDGLGRRIGFKTDSMVIENQNAIQCAIEDGLVFALGGIKRASRLSVFAACLQKKTD